MMSFFFILYKSALVMLWVYDTLLSRKATYTPHSRCGVDDAREGRCVGDTQQVILPTATGRNIRLPDLSKHIRSFWNTN